MTLLESILLTELLITWIILCRCENRQIAIAWSFFWWFLIPIQLFRATKRVFIK